MMIDARRIIGGMMIFGAASLTPIVGIAYAAETACPSNGDSSAIVAAVEPRLELRLADGRLVRLAGLDPALDTPINPDGAEAARATLAAMVVGKLVTLQLLSETSDRWGRLAAQVFLDGNPQGDAAGGLATSSIAAGLGRYLAEPAGRACRTSFIASEQKARAGRLGLWADPYYAVLAVDDRAGFAERSGTIVLVEGRLTAVVPGPFRTKLQFAARDEAKNEGRTLTALILPRPMKTFEAQHMDFKVLIGRTLRLRGLLDQRFGPQIALAGPDEVEVVEDAAGPPTGTP